MNRKAIIRIPAGFNPQTEYSPDGSCEIEMNMTVREIEAQPFTVTQEFLDFVRRADVSESTVEGAFEAAEKAFRKTFAKLSIIEKLTVEVEE